MLNRFVRRINLSIIIVTSILLIIGFWYENPLFERGLKLMVLSLLFLGVLIFLTYSTRISKREYGYIILLVLLSILDFYSKYAISYYYHLLYLFVILSAIMNLRRNLDLLISILVVLFSSIKLIQLIYVTQNYYNITFLIFYLVIEGLLILTFLMGKAYFIEAEEKKDLLKLTERTRIARDLHDTLGHEMTGLIMHLELTKKQFEKDSNEAMLMLDDGITTARASLRKIRGIVDTLRDLKDEDYDSLELLIDSFKTKTGVNVELNINKTLESRPCSKVIYRIVQEALTNSVRHGKASKVIISIINGSNEIMFEVEDDGVGVDIINLGNGLNGMKERINECHGEIHFESNQGFRIYGVIPKEEDNA